MRCHMVFSDLPFDEQSCPVYVESYATDANHVRSSGLCKVANILFQIDDVNEAMIGVVTMHF